MLKYWSYKMLSNMIKVLIYLMIVLLVFFSIEVFVYGVDDKIRVFLE